MSGLRLVKGEDFPDPDNELRYSQVMLGIQYPKEWNGFEDAELVDAITDRAPQFLRAIFQAVKIERDEAKKDSKLHAPVSVIPIEGVDLPG